MAAKRQEFQILCYPSLSIKGIGLKRQSYFYSVVLEFLSVTLYLSDSSLPTSIFKQLTITSDCCKRYRPETSIIFILLGTGIALVLFYIYPIVPHSSAFLHSLPLPITSDCCKRYRQKQNCQSFCLYRTVQKCWCVWYYYRIDTE